MTTRVTPQTRYAYDLAGRAVGTRDANGYWSTQVWQEGREPAMTPCYECNWIVTGNSINKGPFREEGSSSIRRHPQDTRSKDELRQEFIQRAIEYIYEHEHMPRRPEPKYTGTTNLSVELGEILTIG